MYSLKGNMTNVKLKKIIREALHTYKDEIREIIPEDYLTSYKIPFRNQAIYTMHFPKSKIELKHARRRFIYEELLLFQLKMQLLDRKSTRLNSSHVRISYAVFCLKKKKKKD